MSSGSFVLIVAPHEDEVRLEVVERLAQRLQVLDQLRRVLGCGGAASSAPHS